MRERLARFEGGRVRGAALGATVGTAALLLLSAYSARAFHIDDAIYLRWAREIATHWSDPYAGEINWFGTLEPIPAVMRNPPLGAYLLALAGTIVGWSERALHLVQLVPSAAFLAASWALARRWCASPNLALAVVAFSPAFFVTSASIMADTLTATGCICAVLAWCRPASPLSTALGALALCVAALTKWYGLGLVPLLVAWEWMAEKRLTRRCLWLLLPLAAALALECWTRAAHGVSILAQAGANALETPATRLSFSRLWSGLAFMGGACSGGLFLLPFLARTHRRSLALLLLPACAAVLVARGAFERWPIAIQLGIWGLVGAALLLVAIRDAWRGGPEPCLLALWLTGTVVFCLFLNWGFPVRNFLPAVPAVAIALARACERVPALARPLGRAALGCALAAGAILALLLLRADTEVAEEARETATLLVHAHPSSRVWFQGHWGFQHYAEAAGARALDRDHPAAQPGDVLLVPLLNTNVFGVSPDRTRTLERRLVPLRSAFVVLGPRSGAGFWADTLGPLPFAWNLGDVAETWVLEQR